MKRSLFLLPLLALAACATPESRVRAELIRAGLKPRYADCMAGRLVDRLSTAELKRLAALPRLARGEVEHMTVEDLVRRARQIGDPHILSVVTTAGIGCAIAA